MMQTKTMLALLCAMSIAGPVLAQSCNTESRRESTPTARFSLDGATVVDNATHLIWMRCALGQAWDGKSCQGEAKTFAWADAVAAIRQLNEGGFAGHNDWRLPAIPELASIVELRCFNPRVNVEVFPATPPQIFWSGMEKMGATQYAYSLDFGGGEARASLKDQAGSLRLVRGGPWWAPPSMPAGPLMGAAGQ